MNAEERAEWDARLREQCEARNSPAPVTTPAPRDTDQDVEQRVAVLREQMEARDAASWAHLDNPPEALAELDEQNAALGRSALVQLEG